MRLQRAAGLLLAVAISGCGGDTKGGPSAGSIRASSAPRFRAVPIARIGSLDDPDQTLTRVGNVVVGPDEELYVSQPTDGNVRVYDSRGNLVRTIGRRGEGPGEFAQPDYLGLKSDTLYVTDNNLGRLNFFLRDGRFVRSQQWITTLRSERGSSGAAMMYDATVPQVFLADGTALVEVSAFEFYVADKSRHEPIRSLGTWAHPFLRIDAQGQPLDTISQQSRETLLFGVTLRGATLYYRIPFDDDSLVALMRDGSGVVEVNRTIAANTRDGTFGVVLISPARDTVFSRTFAYEPRPVPDAVVHQAAVKIPGPRDRGPDASDIERALRANDLVPRTQTPVTALSVGQDGSIWLRREDLAGDSILWNVLDRTGELRGAMRLPAGDSIVAARDDLVVAVYSDELDVPYVVTYRLER